MKETSLASIKPLQNNQFWFLAIAAGLIAVHVSLYFRLNGPLNQVCITLLGLAAVFSLLSEKRHTLKFESDIFSSLLGISLIAFTLYRSLFINLVDFLVDLAPFTGLLGLSTLR